MLGISRLGLQTTFQHQQNYEPPKETIEGGWVYPQYSGT